MAFDHDIGEIRNTQSMCMYPDSPDEFNAMDELHSSGAMLLPVFTGEVFKKIVQYSIIVERWDKKNYGRHKRRWLAEFTQAERNKISKYHGRFYRWHIVSGTPDNVACKLNTIELLKRAVHFFAST